MAGTLRDLREKHNLLTRNAVRVVASLQLLMDDINTPEHFKPHLLACLALLDRGLMGQPLEDERVLIEVLGGIPYVAEKTEYVDVVIRDIDRDVVWP